ncbi:enoyl-CoA delta isomerase 1, mitochondrial-like [Ambystoma mexicanum]|uniref:enoyl-CoA delta isomerase 1, mitochondrial-like n=1 Tax=Ambystoma mexicanum TaxID=8296 RepID=UPI0037E8D905
MAALALLRGSVSNLKTGTLHKRRGLFAEALCLVSTQRRMINYSKISVEMDSNTGVAVMAMKSPPVNSMSLDFLTEVAIGLDKLEMDKGCRGVIITSAVPKIFSAGLDITEMCGKSAEHYGAFWRAVQDLWLKLYASNMVTIAAINGSSPAGGCLMSMACDYRIMADDPKFTIGLNETRLGIVAPFWFKDTMLNTLGNRETEKALQLGLMYSPQEALKAGMVDQLVPEDKVLAAASSAMSTWLAIPDHARQLTKSMMRKPTRDRLFTHRDADITSFVNFISKDSIQKSLQVYMEQLKQRKS